MNNRVVLIRIISKIRHATAQAYDHYQYHYQG